MIEINVLIENYPLVSLFVISFLVSLFSTIVNKYATDQGLLKSIKERQKELQKEMKSKKYSPQDKRYIAIQQEMMSLTGKMLKSSFRPMIITAIPFLAIFYLLRNSYMPLLGNSWIWYYIFFVVISGLFWKKILKTA